MGKSYVINVWNERVEHVGYTRRSAAWMFLHLNEAMQDYNLAMIMNNVKMVEY